MKITLAKLNALDFESLSEEVIPLVGTIKYWPFEHILRTQYLVNQDIM